MARHVAQNTVTQPELDACRLMGGFVDTGSIYALDCSADGRMLAFSERAGCGSALACS